MNRKQGCRLSPELWIRSCYRDGVNSCSLPFRLFCIFCIRCWY